MEIPGSFLASTETLLTWSICSWVMSSDFTWLSGVSVAVRPSNIFFPDIPDVYKRQGESRRSGRHEYVRQEIEAHQ